MGHRDCKGPFSLNGVSAELPGRWQHRPRFAGLCYFFQMTKATLEGGFRHSVQMRDLRLIEDGPDTVVSGECDCAG